MHKVFGLALVAGCVTLAVIIGQRMSTDAMAVAIGVVFGVAASIPTSLLLIAATRPRREERAALQRPDFPSAVQAPPPQIYIVSPSGSQPQPAPWGNAGAPLNLPMPPNGYYGAEPGRRFKVVGEDEHWLDWQE